MSTFSLISPGRASTTAASRASDRDHVQHPVRSRRFAPAHRRDRRPAARSVDRAGRDRRRGRGQQEAAAAVAVLPARARGADPAPARRPAPRRAAARQRRADLARAAGGDRAARNPVRGRGLRSRRSAGVLGSRPRPLRQPHADVGLSLDRPGDPRRERGPRRGRHSADAAGGRSRSVVAPICCRRTTRAPRIIARLPFGARGNARSGGDALGRSAAAPSRRPAPTARCSPSKPRPTSAARGFSGCWRRRAWSAPSSPPASMPGRRPSDRDRRFRAALPIRASPHFRTAARSRRCIGCWRSAATPCRCRQRRSRPAPRKAEPQMTRITGPAPRPGILDIAPYVGGEAQDRRGRAADPPRLERERAGAQPQGDGRLSGARRRDPPLSRRQRRDRCARRSAAVTGSTRRGSSAAPARTS